MPHENQFQLLGKRRFLPLFLVQFLGAFNDNVFKNAFVILITFSLAAKMGWSAEIAVSIVSGVFILPFFLFSAFAGQLADKLEKTRMIRWVKIWEILAMALASAGFLLQDAYFLYVVLFMMGAHSTFFGPIKYSILPDHLKDRELVAGNAMIEAGTYVAILGGTLLGGLVILHTTMDPVTGLTRHDGLWEISAVTLLIAAAGLAASFWIPPAPSRAPNLRINPNFIAETWHLIAHARKNAGVFRCILGISWFWLIGATWLTIIPAYAKGHLHGDENTFTFLLTLFSVGIGAGSLACNRLLGGEISAKFVPISGLALSLFTFDFVWFSGSGLPDGPFRYLSWSTLRLAVDLTGVAVSGGIFSVPLYALLQSWSDPEYRSRNIAANNVINALFMVAAALVTAGLFALNWTIPHVLALVAALNVAVSLYTIRLVPQPALQGWMKKIRAGKGEPEPQPPIQK